ncbi:MAG: hypothetical protein WD556_08045 [Actinomycetota bacterium]
MQRRGAQDNWNDINPFGGPVLNEEPYDYSPLVGPKFNVKISC